MKGCSRSRYKAHRCKFGLNGHVIEIQYLIIEISVSDPKVAHVFCLVLIFLHMEDCDAGRSCLPAKGAPKHTLKKDTTTGSWVLPGPPLGRTSQTNVTTESLGLEVPCRWAVVTATLFPAWAKPPKRPCCNASQPCRTGGIHCKGTTGRETRRCCRNHPQVAQLFQMGENSEIQSSSTF